MNKLFERAIYSFGVNMSGYDVRRELSHLQNNLPKKNSKADTSLTSVAATEG